MRKYLTYKNKARLALALLLQTLRTVGEVGVAVLINYLIDSVALAIESSQITGLGQCAIVCCSYAATLGLVIFLSERANAACIRNIMIHVREDVVAGILGKNMSEHQGTNSAEHIALLNQNLSTFEESYLKNLLSIYESIVSIAIAITLLFLIHPLIAVVSIVAMAIPSFLPQLFGGKLGNLQGAIMQRTADYNVKVKDILNGYEVIKSYRLDNIMLRKHGESAENLEQSKASLANAMAWVYGLVNFASISVQFLVMALCGVFAVRVLVTIGSIIAVTQLTGLVISPAFELSAKFSQLKSTKPICEQILALSEAAKPTPLQTSRMVTDGLPKPENMVELEHSLSLEDLSFSYEDVPAIKHVDTVFEHGKKYAIVGKSGSGKSTLLKILAGYYQNYEGHMSVDGVEGKICELSLISQDIFLFDDTIRNNITLYQDCAKDALDNAVRMAGLEGTIGSLANGLDTEVEENGSRFSGGERQRIAIARALLHKKSLLLLDEATSALDNECAKQIEESILGLEGITCIAITHQMREDVMRKYDKILVMENGEIVEEGTFQDLLDHSETFRKLHAAGALASNI